MILRFYEHQILWEAVPGCPQGLVIQANQVAGNVEKQQIGTDPEPYWQIIATRADVAVMAADEPLYGTYHLLVSRPLRRVTLHAADTHHIPNCWYVTINTEARILLPDFNPEWRAHAEPLSSWDRLIRDP